MKIKYIFLFFLCFLFLSCGPIYLKLITKKEVKTYTYYNDKTSKTLVAFHMFHVNTPEFFQDVKEKLDSLRKEGFVVFYEGVGFNRENYNAAEIDTFFRKFRKLAGFHLTSYKDSTNASLPKYLTTSKYLMQTDSLMGITKEDLRVDLPLDSLINIYEKKKQEIVLTNCDFNTPLNAKYTCETLGSFSIFQTYRNDYIEKRIMESRQQKIALVYGRKHFYFLRGAFQQNGFVRLEK